MSFVVSGVYTSPDVISWIFNGEIFTTSTRAKGTAVYTITKRFSKFDLRPVFTPCIIQTWLHAFLYLRSIQLDGRRDHLDFVP